MATATLPPIQSRAAAFAEGCKVPWQGLLHMCRHPALWRHAVVPVLMNLIITACVLIAVGAAIVAFATWLHPKFSDTWGGWTVEILTVIGLAVAAAGVAAATWLLLQGILCGHFYGKLAREVELQMGTPPDEIRDIPLHYQVADALRDFLSLLGINACFLLLHCIPVVGSLAGFCGALYFDCLIFGRDYFDFPLALRGRRRSEKLEFLRRQRMHVLGLGAVVLLMNFVPLIGAVLLTTAVTGGVLLHRRLTLPAPGA